MTTNPLFSVPPPVEIARMINGEPMLSTAGMSLLMGVGADYAHQYLKRDPHIPVEWVKAGRRRAAEYRAHTGRTDMLGSLAYWAERDFDADIVEGNDGTISMAARR